MERRPDRLCRDLIVGEARPIAVLSRNFFNENAAEEHSSRNFVRLLEGSRSSVLAVLSTLYSSRRRKALPGLRFKVFSFRTCFP